MNMQSASGLDRSENFKEVQYCNNARRSMRTQQSKGKQEHVRGVTALTVGSNSMILEALRATVEVLRCSPP